MCSISGVLATDLVDCELIVRMNAAQRHRGPDDEGVWSREFERGSVALGNTRLAIIDTSAAGHQPMVDPESGNFITYNGETYNFKTIPVNARSKTDTEVVLHAYREWGGDAFAKLRGMFALAIWDEQKRELVLARDRFGIKPLYYYVSDHLFIFASELRALLASGLVPRKLSQAGLMSYLENGSVQAPLTIVEGIRQLLPGDYMRVSVTEKGHVECAIHHYAPDKHESSQIEDRREAVARLRAELEESVRLHLVSDVPLGVFLSGGMDSSALVALMSRVSDQRPKTFSVVFDEQGFSEANYSRAVAARFQTDHCEISLSEEQLLAMLPQAIAALDQPTMDGINTFVVSRAVKSAGVTVALSGLGGDELFAGYPSFRRALKFASLPKTSRRVLRAAAGVGKVALNGSIRREKFWELVESGDSAEKVYQTTRQLFSTTVLREIFGKKKNGLESQAATVDGNNGDVVNAISRLEMQGYMANTLLRDTDAMSMAHSLEVRVPFVDVNVVEFALSLPGEWKLDHRSVLGYRSSHVPKPLLADAVSDLLPRDFLARRKMGFTLPFEKWMQGRIRSELSSVFEDDRQLADAGLAAHGVRDLWRRFLRAPRTVGWTRPWSLFVLVKWCQLNRVTL